MLVKYLLKIPSWFVIKALLKIYIFYVIFVCRASEGRRQPPKGERQCGQQGVSVLQREWLR